MRPCRLSGGRGSSRGRKKSPGRLEKCCVTMSRKCSTRPPLPPPLPPHAPAERPCLTRRFARLTRKGVRVARNAGILGLPQSWKAGINHGNIFLFSLFSPCCFPSHHQKHGVAPFLCGMWALLQRRRLSQASGACPRLNTDRLP